jgi:hypothetical protein
MEDHRCKAVASAMDDLRCISIFGSAHISVSSPRYNSLGPTVDLDVEDDRCNFVQLEMEDPRCQNLASKW